MNIFMLGATGRIGRHLLPLALSEGHRVTVLVRDPFRVLIAHKRLTVLQGDATNLDDLLRAAKDSNAVMSALSTDGGTVLSECAPLLVQAMKASGIRRIVTIGTAGILNSRIEPHLLRYQSSESRRTASRSAEEHRNFYRVMESSGLDWTIVCPTYLPDGEYTGVYRVERDYLPLGGERISVADTAEYSYKQLFLSDNIRSRVGICY